jgi:hypothetical protein
LKRIRAKRPRLRLDPEAYRQLCQEVLERDGWRCQSCGRMENLQVHHIRPRSRLGDNTTDNLISETPKVNLLHGGFPEVLARPKSRGLWFASYLQTYLERDVRAITNVRDLVTFWRFLALLASRHGQILNKTDLAAPLGVSVPTISEWLHILESPVRSWSCRHISRTLGKD